MKSIETATPEVAIAPSGEATNQLPGIEIALNGFNSKAFNFVTLRVFKTNYGRPNPATITYHGKSYTLPESLAVTTIHSESAFSNSYTRILETKEDYVSFMSGAVTVSGKMALGYKGSAGSEIAARESLFKDDKHVYTTNAYGILAYRLKRPSHHRDVLTDNFVDAVLNLPEKYEKRTQRAYFEFFEQFGTYFLYSGFLGGYAAIETAIDDTLYSKSTNSHIEAQIQAGYDGLVASAEISASAVRDHSSYLKEHSKEININIFGVGGTFQSNKDAFFKSIYQDPVLILPSQSINVKNTLKAPVFHSIVELVQPAGGSVTLEQQLTQAIKDYEFDYLMEDSNIGNGYHPETSITNKSTFPGFYVGSVMMNGGFWTPSIKLKAGNTSKPTTVVGEIGTGTTDRSSFYNNMLVPIPENYNYRLNGINSLNFRFMPINEDAYNLGAYQKIEDGDHTAETDGFVIGIMHSEKASEGGNPAVIKGSIRLSYLDHNKPTVMGKAASDVALMFTMPVPKDCRYNLSFEPSPDTPSCTFYWMSIEFQDEAVTSSVFGQFQLKHNQTAYRATQDGFFIGLSTEKGDGGDNNGKTMLLQNKLPIVNGSFGTGVINSFNLPVARGTYYTMEGDHATCYYLPLAKVEA